jgi:hypothetical protein
MRSVLGGGIALSVVHGLAALCRASFMSKMIMVDGHSIKYQIWDT